MDNEGEIRNGVSPWFPAGTGRVILEDFGHEAGSAYAQRFARHIERAINVAFGSWVGTLIGHLAAGTLRPEDIISGQGQRLPKVPGVNMPVVAVEIGVAPSMVLSRAKDSVGVESVLTLLGFQPGTTKFFIAREVIGERIDRHAGAGMELLIDLAATEDAPLARMIGIDVWQAFPEVKILDLPTSLSSYTVSRLAQATSERDGFLSMVKQPA